MKKLTITFIALITITLFSCSSDSKNSSTGSDTSRLDSVNQDSLGADGTAKSRSGTTEDSTVMGTPADKSN